MTEQMTKFGLEWTMFYAAHRAAGTKTEQQALLAADQNLQDLIRLRIPVGSVWVMNNEDLTKCLIRVTVLRHDAESGVELQKEHDKFKWFEPVSVLLDESRWFRVAQ